MMGDVLVRGVPDTTIARLKTRAEMRGHSLQQELREILDREAVLTPAECMRRFEIFDATHGRIPADVDITALIREERDAR
jgi:plasmid stability protein